MNLRPAVLADCLTLAAIDAQGNPSPWTAQQFESAVQHHPDSVWLSQTDHQITGFIVWQTVFDEGLPCASMAERVGQSASKAGRRFTVWFGTSMSARHILGLEKVPRVGLFAH